MIADAIQIAAVFIFAVILLLVGLVTFFGIWLIANDYHPDEPHDHDDEDWHSWG